MWESMNNNPRLFLKYLKNVKNAITGYPYPPHLILFVTDKCNAKCSHCFFWKDLNQVENDLSLEEIEKIFRNFPGPISYLYLTGGEPFLRKDIVDICLIAERYAGVKDIQIPTNGILGDRIVDFVKSIFRTFQGIVTIQISLDDYEELHDKNRGVSGTFKMAVETATRLRELQTSYSNLKIFINTTVSNKNYKGLHKLETFVKNELGLPHNFELIRGSSFSTSFKDTNDFNPKDSGTTLPEKLELIALHSKLLHTIKTVSPKGFIEKIGKEFGLLSLRSVYRPLLKAKFEVKCLAGELIGVIYSDGKVAFCELTMPIGDLRENNYQFLKAWRTKEANLLRKKLKKCYCTHGCFMLPSTMYSQKNILKALIAALLKIRIGYGTSKDISAPGD
jgi:MoaA/NifB/PqqE/SkfB family radical SAM enzyme